jgi:hypothetical protein
MPWTCPSGASGLRAAGSAGSHNGLRSTLQHLGSQEFDRLRIGIGAPAREPQERKARTVGRVPGRFSSSERLVLAALISGIGLIHHAVSGLTTTTARLRLLHQSFSPALLEGEVSAGGFQWPFGSAFDRGKLIVESCLGRALIQDDLLRLVSTGRRFRSYLHSAGAALSRVGQTNLASEHPSEHYRDAISP